MTFRFLPHTADIKFVAQGSSFSSLFNACTRAVSSYILESRRLPRGTRERALSLRAQDQQSALYLFIEELIYLCEVKRLVPVKARVSFKEGVLSGTCWCVPLSKRQVARSIKAPTFAEMYVRKRKGVWSAQVVLDV